MIRVRGVIDRGQARTDLAPGRGWMSARRGGWLRRSRPTGAGILPDPNLAVRTDLVDAGITGRHSSSTRGARRTRLLCCMGWRELATESPLATSACGAVVSLVLRAARSASSARPGLSSGLQVGSKVSPPPQPGRLPQIRVAARGGPHPSCLQTRFGLPSRSSRVGSREGVQRTIALPTRLRSTQEGGPRLIRTGVRCPG
jgi:hypothetical protein